MAGMETFDPVAAAQEVSEQIIPRLHGLNISTPEVQEASQLVFEFNKIAAQMLQGSPGLDVGNGQVIPWEPALAMQALTLFAEGIYFAFAKCVDLRSKGMDLAPLQVNLLQELALDVYKNAEYMVMATYGQEATSVQFSMEQQAQFMAQAAETALVAQIDKYEKEFGPIPVIESEELFQSLPEELLEEEAPPEVTPAPAPRAARQPAPRPQAKGPSPHDKYAAVALLLGTLGPEKRQKILANFNQDERELITYYSYPDHIQQNLDTASVHSHLKRFKEMLQQGGSSLRSSAYRGIARLAKSNPMEKLLSYVKDERPKVLAYVAAHYESEDALSGEEGSEPRHFTDELPPRVEEILYRYLSKRVSANEGSSRAV